MSSSARSATLILLGALFIPSTLASVRLDQIQPIVGFNDDCTLAYQTTVASCSLSDFTLYGGDGSCSAACYLKQHELNREYVCGINIGIGRGLYCCCDLVDFGLFSERDDGLGIHQRGIHGDISGVVKLSDFN
ncbi:hypothetical protein DV735_g160, partial [Chaetothyriales sp. CBS 134920]